MIDFWKITPGGNPTVLLREEDVPLAHAARLAALLMDPLHIGCEQAGFVRLGPHPALIMMGGEFCLNATRAFALLLADEGLLPQVSPTVWEGEVLSSGAAAPVLVRVERDADGQNGPWGGWAASARIDLAGAPPPVFYPEGEALIRLPGISHILMGDAAPEPAATAEICSRARARHCLENEDAAGCLWLRGRDLHPAVWVRATQSLCVESACGSGTLACALALRARDGGEFFSFRQPSGASLDVRFEQTERGLAAWVGGPARMVAKGRLEPPCLLA